MKYTIKDNNNNLICSVESNDPTKSIEMNGFSKAGIIGVGSLIATLLISKINKTKNIKKIINKYGKEKLTKVGNYINSINENSFKLITNYIKNQCKDKADVKFIDNHSYSRNKYGDMNITPANNSNNIEKKMIKQMIKNSFDDISFPTFATFKIISSNVTPDRKKDINDFHNNIIINTVNSFNIDNKNLDYNIENLHNIFEEDVSEYNQYSRFYITTFTIYYDIKLNKDKLESILSTK